ncbi:MAG: DEAD/DEAH box helicase [Chitinophagales bacterium]
MQFEELDFNESLMEGLMSMGFKTLTPIQEKAIPHILHNDDLIACAQTGTGKTAAFLLPVMDKIIRRGHDHINTLILVPTRELAVQIDNTIQGLSYFTDIKSMPINGGNDGIVFAQEQRALESGADIIVATPGRLISHITHNERYFDRMQHLILDEADRMLDMGFHDAIMRIISTLPKERQTLLFSATMPPKIRTLASKLLKHPKEVNIALSRPAEGVTQEAYFAQDDQKTALLQSILQERDPESVLVFSSTKEKVKNLERELFRKKINVKAIHSDLEQPERKEVLRLFANKKLQVLVATDILSRGIDIDSIDLVVNYDVPGDAHDYVHRVGRTARAASKGTAITFISHRDKRKFDMIERLIGYPVKKISLPDSIPVAQPKQHSGAHRRPGNKRRGR